MVEFDCADCGEHIISMGLTVVPADHRCRLCQDLAEFVPDLAEREAMRRWIRGIDQIAKP